jgi:hypothetical protein
MLPEDVTALAMTGTIRISHLAPLLGNRQRSASLIPVLGKRTTPPSEQETGKIGGIPALFSVVPAVVVGGSQQHHASVEVEDPDSESEGYDFAEPDDVARHLENYIYFGDTGGNLV